MDRPRHVRVQVGLHVGQPPLREVVLTITMIMIIITIHTS